MGVFLRPDLAVHPVDDPLEDPHVVLKPGQTNLPFVHLEPPTAKIFGGLRIKAPVFIQWRK